MKIYKFRAHHTKDSTFIKLLFGVAGLQVIIMILIAGIIVTSAIIPSEKTFEASPPSEKQRQEIKDIETKFQKHQKVSNQLVKRINVARVADMPTPDVSIDLPSGMGGGGVGGGVDISSIKLDKLTVNINPVDLFGIKAKAEKILILFDTGQETMRDEMGGLDAFNVVKSEITRLVKELPSLALFNVIAFDSDVGNIVKFKMFSKKLVSASEKAKSGLEKWMANINPDISNIGIVDSEYSLKYPIPPRIEDSLPLVGRKFRQGILKWGIYQGAIEQGAEVIFILTAKWTMPEEYMMPIPKANGEKYVKDWKENIRKAKEVAKKEIISYQEYMQKANIEKAKAKKWLDEENARRKKKGIPQRVVRDLGEVAHELKLLPLKDYINEITLRPDHRKYGTKFYTRNSLMAAYNPIFKKVYDEKKQKRPIVNYIVMLSKNGDIEPTRKSALRSWANMNKGKVLILRGAKPVKEFEADKGKGDASTDRKN